jgi:drug/metabolite transporter (DMT)-like permease
MAVRHRSIFDRLPSLVYLWIAVLIFAASNSVTRKVTEIGASHLIDGRNPISLCNVLFVGNLCAFAVMLLVFGKQWKPSILRSLTRGDWYSMGAIALLSGALGPGLIFAALDQTSVTNVVLIGRLEPPLILLLSGLFLGVRVNFCTAAGSLVSFLGVVATTLSASSAQQLPLMGGWVQIGWGELQAAAAAIVLAIAAILSKLRLQQIPLGLFSMVRVGLGTLVFYLLARTLFGSQHFADAFTPLLWQWMVLYGAVIVVAGQLCWLAGGRHATPAQSNLANSFSPPAAILMAYLILGEVPTAAQLMGGAVIFLGIALSFMGSLQEANAHVMASPITPAQQMVMLTGFKGI